MKLKSLVCNKPTFKPVLFHDGLNLVLAERSDVSQSTDSRNGVGKSTLLQIIDFCLGGSIRAGDSVEKLIGGNWIFRLTLSVTEDAEIEVSRAVDASGVVEISGDVLILMGIEPDLTGTATVGLRTWTDWLGIHCFGLPDRAVGEQYAPSFRRLIGHFLRFRKDAYVDPFETFAKQPSVQRHVDNSFLLFLAWELAVEWQRLKDREKSLGGLTREEIAEQLGELDSRRIRVSGRSQQLTRQIETFEVLPEYRDVERRANRLTRRMQDLANALTVDGRLIDLYANEVRTEATGLTPEALTELYDEVGVHFGSTLIRSLDEVNTFHEIVIANRQEYLSAELRRLQHLQDSRRETLATLDTERASVLSILRTHGALEEFSDLQKAAGALAGEIELMDARINELRELRKGKAAIRVAQVEWQERAAIDLEQRMSRLAPIIERFSSAFDELYNESADLVIEVGDGGYRYRISVPKQGSLGLSKVSVFAYDLAVTEAWSSYEGGAIRCLMHDSTVFDGVDERQIAGMLLRSSMSAAEYGYQYLVTANTDVLSAEELTRVGLNLKEYTILTLDDSTDEGGLLGVRL